MSYISTGWLQWPETGWGEPGRHGVSRPTGAEVTLYLEGRFYLEATILLEAILYLGAILYLETDHPCTWRPGEEPDHPCTWRQGEEPDHPCTWRPGEEGEVEGAAAAAGKS